jgi:hypothetical protein
VAEAVGGIGGVAGGEAWDELAEYGAEKSEAAWEG